MKTSSSQLALFNPQLRTPEKSSVFLGASVESAKSMANFAASLAQIKQIQDDIKNKKMMTLKVQESETAVAYHLKARREQQKSPKNLQFCLQNNKKNTQQSIGKPAKVYASLNISKSTQKSLVYCSNETTIKSQQSNRKDPIYSNYEQISNKPRFHSPVTNHFKLIETDKKSQKYDISQQQSKYCEQNKLLKKSKHSEQDTSEKESDYQPKFLKSIKNLKETVSTSSSTKSRKALKIQDFVIIRDLGSGKFGNVKMVQHKKTGMLFSIKIINKQMVKEENIIPQLIKETKIQSFLNHSHIVKLYSVFDDIENVYLLMELCCEGNLYDYIQNKGKLPQEQAKQFLKQTCEAVGELHSNNIIHRDLKPENIVMCFGMVKLCDFGWSTQIIGNMRETFCGSPLYISPQLLKGQLYDEKVDLWSLGILGFELMTGTIPFEIKTERDLSKIVNTKIVYPNWMSQSAVSFLQELLNKNPNNRSSIDKILGHYFIK